MHYSPIMDTLVSIRIRLQMRSPCKSITLVHHLIAAMMKIEGDNKPTISGGPLNGTYIFAQLHFHWGGNDTCGSEKKFDKKSFPLELHIVFHKKDYLNVDSALNYPDGLTVLACIFQVI